MKNILWFVTHPIYATSWFATKHCYSSFVEWRNNGLAV
jgi:hypothetical protein